MGLNDGILDFEGRSPVRRRSLNFFWFSGEVSEQSDQVARKPDFWLRTSNNDPKTEGWELEILILSLKWLSMLQTSLEFVLIQFGLYNPNCFTLKNGV